MSEDLLTKAASATYTEDDFETLSWNEHIRRRSGMYIGKLGDGSSPDDGIYVLFKEIIDNAIDEFIMGYGKSVEITIQDNMVTVRDYGRGIPLGKVIDAVSKMNTGAKYGSSAFSKSVGLNGVGTKAVNATSTYFYIQSFRDGQTKYAQFSKGNLVESADGSTTEKNGTLVKYIADPELYPDYKYNMEFLDTMLRNYSYLNTGLSLKFNGVEYKSKNGLLDLITENISETPLYPIIHISGKDIEIAITHGTENGENISSFVNGQNTYHGGTHLAAFREGVAKTIKEFYKKDFDPKDVRQSIVGAISIKIVEPSFSNQTKTFLNSKEVAPGGQSVRNFIVDFVSSELDNYLHKHPEITEPLLKKILESEKERKAISGIQKLARERAKKASLHNKKLRDCRIHYGDKDPRNQDTMLFITEGDSASGSITKSRNANTQAVFSLRGKPKNCYGLTKEIVYKNEEFNLLQAALNIEDDLENLRYNKVVVATDADVDGMHIRLLILTFFLQFFPDLIRQGHLYILQTPLFRVTKKKISKSSKIAKNKKKDDVEVIYCYSSEEKEKAIKKLGKDSEITRFKGLGEISPDEFGEFIGENIRLDRVRLSKDDVIGELLEFYMGNNTPERQNFIRTNLRSDLILEEIADKANV
ncbi:MAG: type IIA DNA topoisomerase subunit B [Bacteroidales bacterium]|jgi:topoisomerase-4 subunit B|nr:type IIA DNA topoisomerase subunit B [Bacteroidales bacterium]